MSDFPIGECLVCGTSHRVTETCAIPHDEPETAPRQRRNSHLTTADFARLNHACLPVREAFGFGSCYLVGSAGVGGRVDFRDVDVRVILADEEFDRLFPDELPWSLFCLGMTEYLCRVSGLPIDFQVQRRTEANEKYGDKPRNPIGTTERPFAGGGDATPFYARKLPAAPEAPTGPVLGVCDNLALGVAFDQPLHVERPECVNWRPVAPEGSAT